MKYYYYLPLYCALASAQQTSTFTFDVNGQPMEGASHVNTGNAKREVVRSINGRSVPLQSTEDHVVSDSGGVKVVERLVKRFDDSGNPLPSDKVRIEERKNADGSGSVATTVMRADVNGNYQLAERTKAERQKSGDTLTTSTQVERPTLNGGLEMVEKRDETLRESKSGDADMTATVYKRDTNGRLSEAAKQTMQRTVNGPTAVENAAVYEATNGSLSLVKQTVSTISKASNGAEHKETNVFVPNALGRVDSGSKPQLLEQQIIEKTPTAGGSVEILSVRRATDNPGKLGAPQKVAESVCRGECK